MSYPGQRHTPQSRPPQSGGPRGPMGPGGGGGFRQGNPHSAEFPAPSAADLRAIIVEGDTAKLVEVADRVGKALADRRDQLSTNQIRAIFGAVREIEMSWPENGQDATRTRRSQRQLLLLKPKLAYQAKRAQGRGVENLRQVLDPAIGLVGDDRERFQNFADFFEAILAYHYSYSGQ